MINRDDYEQPSDDWLNARRPVDDIEELFNIVSENVQGVASLTYCTWPDLGLRREEVNGEEVVVGEGDDVWEIGMWFVDVYEPPLECLGGPHDGARHFGGFMVDLLPLIQELDSDEVCGDSEAIDSNYPCSIAISGKYKGNYYFIRVCLVPPEDALMVVQLTQDGKYFRRPPTEDED